jgi:RNA polymerase sigma-70 factor (ECF subfamily)
MEGISKFRHESKVSTWVYQIALNVAISDLRKIKRKPVSQSLDELHHDIPDWIPDSAQEEKLQLLYKAMEHLSSVEKALLMLYFEEKENEEIADIMGITANNVRVKMTRIREKLRTEIGQK